MADKILHAVYDDDDKLMDAVKDLKASNFYIDEVYTPFPVHGLDKALGLKPTRLAILSFIYGCIGFSFAIFMMNYIMIGLLFLEKIYFTLVLLLLYNGIMKGLVAILQINPTTITVII